MTAMTAVELMRPDRPKIPIPEGWNIAAASVDILQERLDCQTADFNYKGTIRTWSGFPLWELSFPDRRSFLEAQAQSLKIDMYGFSVDSREHKVIARKLGETLREISLCKSEPTAGMQNRFDTASDLLAVKVAPEFIIDDFIPARSTGMIFGPSGHGKTFIVLDCIFHVATGRPWRGLSVKKGLCILFCGEGRQGIGRRLAALCQYYGVELAELDLLLVSKGTEDIAESGDEVAAWLSGYAKLKGTVVSLVVVDTLARHLGGDENSNRDMSIFIGACDRLREALPGASILLVHHSGHAQDAQNRGRGASALRAALDFEIRCASGLLTSTKCKDMEPFRPVPFKLHPVDLGERVTSCVPIYGERSEKERQAGLTEPEKSLLQILKDHEVSSLQDAKKAYQDSRPEASYDASRMAFNRALDGLLSKHVIKIEADYITLLNSEQVPNKTEQCSAG